MTAQTVIADLDDPSVVHGVHGTDGVSHWKCLARRNDLLGPLEAVEWARLPEGGISGEHLHTRTEELYFVLSGTGVMLIDGKEHPVGPGDLVLTGVGTRHGLRNAGPNDLCWLVVEVLSPETAAVFAGEQKQFEREG